MKNRNRQDTESSSIEAFSGIKKMESKWGITFATPAIIGFSLFTLIPIGAALYFSFTDWEIGGREINFIGLSNYKEMFTEDPLFYQALGNTFYYAIGSISVIMIVAFFVAILLNQKVKGLPIFRTIYYLPVVVPSIANIMLWLWLFNPDFGLLNNLLRQFGMSGSNWVFGQESALPSLILMSSWGMGNTMIVFLAGLQGIPTHLYEAAEIDGANDFQKFIHVTIPYMTPTILFNLIMSIIGSLQVFNEAYIMTDGGPNNATLFYVFYLFREAFTNSRMGYATALAWILFIIVVVLSSLVFLTSGKWVYYEGGRK